MLLFKSQLRFFSVHFYIEINNDLIHWSKVYLGLQSLKCFLYVVFYSYSHDPSTSNAISPLTFFQYIYTHDICNYCNHLLLEPIVILYIKLFLSCSLIAFILIYFHYVIIFLLRRIFHYICTYIYIKSCSHFSL